MEHFADVLMTPCCGNYSCVQCTLDYLSTKDIISDSASINEVLAKVNKRNNDLTCPQCMQNGYCPMKVILGVKVRSYSNTPQAKELAASHAFASSDVDSNDVDRQRHTRRLESSFNVVGTDIKADVAAVSPVRIGDSFEDLKRKMRKFAPSVSSVTTNSTSSDTSCVGPTHNNQHDSPVSSCADDENTTVSTTVDVVESNDILVLRLSESLADPFVKSCIQTAMKKRMEKRKEIEFLIRRCFLDFSNNTNSSTGEA
jgi:hypothetical protein